jgi:hypothetical protein
MATPGPNDPIKQVHNELENVQKPRKVGTRIGLGVLHDDLLAIKQALEKTANGTAPRDDRTPLPTPDAAPESDDSDEMKWGEKFDRAVFDVVSNTLSKIGNTIKSKMGIKQELTSKSGITYRALSEQTQQRQELLKLKSNPTRLSVPQNRATAATLAPVAAPAPGSAAVPELTIKNIENLKVTAKNVTIEGFDPGSIGGDTIIGGIPGLPGGKKKTPGAGTSIKTPSTAGKIAKIGGRALGVAGVAYAGYDAYESNKERGTGTATAIGASTMGGTMGGAALGAMIGAAGGPVGVFVGGVIGGILGSLVGQYAGETVADSVGATGSAKPVSPAVSGVGGLTYNQLTQAQKDALIMEQRNQEGFKPGTLAYRMNNPGNIIVNQKTGQPYTPQQQFGATRGDTSKASGLTFAKFPDLKSGEAAQKELWERKYGNVPLETALGAWAKPGSGYKSGIYKAISSAGPVPDTMPAIPPTAPATAVPNTNGKKIDGVTKMFNELERKDSKPQPPVIIAPPAAPAPRAADKQSQVMLPISGVRSTENAFERYVNRSTAFV